MFKLLFLMATLVALASCGKDDDGVNWALLVAGSNEYYNYRHQADVCHAYQILHKNGIPDERIVVMMYDDIAHNSQNPVKGNIINRPDGPNVYNGTLKDWTGKSVTPTNFLNVLQGKKDLLKGVDGSGKVIASGPNDNVFLFFSDHGAPGLVAFPDGSVLHAAQLNSAIKNMHNNKQFKNMLVYIEACESGSMFENLLPENINVYATTASNSEESSYACYYDDKRQTYLGDLYSVNWMEDSDKENIQSETLSKQFQIVQKLTNASHVMQWGNVSMANFFTVSDFQAEKTAHLKPHIGFTQAIPKTDLTKTEDVRLEVLRRSLAVENDIEKQKLLSDEIKLVQMLKKATTTRMLNIIQTVYGNDMNAVKEITNKRQKAINHECYMQVVDKALEKCFTSKNDYALRQLFMFVNMCSRSSSTQIISAIETICTSRLD